MEQKARLILRVRERGPMTVAMAISTLMHAAILLLVGANLDPRAIAELAPPLSLAVMLEMPGTGDDERRGVHGAEAAPLAADRLDALEDARARKPAVARSAEAPREAVTPTEPARGRRGGPGPDVFEVRSAPATVAALSLAGLIGTPARPAPMLEVSAPKPVLTAPAAPDKVATYSPRQQSMLVRKVDDWARSFDGSHAPDEEVAWSQDGQHYVAHFTAVPGDEMSPDRLIVRVTTGEEGQRLSTTIRMKRLAFSNYVQFVNRWDDSVQIHNDELDGRFHTNSELNLSYSRDVAPRFLGKVTTTARSININKESGYRSRAEIFLGGLETGVPSIRLPKDYVPLPDSLPIREEQVHWFDEDSSITFHADGSYAWVPLESEQFERRGTIREPAFYLLASDDAELHVAGTVAGKVLVFSPRRIVITGDLRYATDPETSEDGDDYLGLVSLRNVEIADPSVTGPGDLEIHGAIYARRVFRVRNYQHRGDGTLDIYGSLTAGSLSATEPRYATRIRFDPRLESRRPPGFPVTDRYELESWDGAWTVEP